MGSSVRITCLLLAFAYVFNVGATTEDGGSGLTAINIGVFVDSSSRIGKEQRVGMEIASDHFNNISANIRVNLQFQNSNRSNPLQAATSAIELVNEKRTIAIITGTDNSEEEDLLGDIGTQYKVPIFSLSGTLASQSLVLKKHSFLVRMTDDYSSQISCIQSLIQNFGWNKVIAVYEDGVGYGSFISSMMDDFSQALQDVGSQIEHQLALPPLEFMTDPKQTIMDELVKVFAMQSRVFVVLHSSLPMASRLFKVANDMGLLGRETAWIVTNNIANLFEALDSSTISYMKGVLGIKTYYDEKNPDFLTFKSKLPKLKQHPGELSFYPGIHALRAYDAISAIVKAFERKLLMGNDMSMPSDILLNEIISRNFTGLSGEISIEDGALAEDLMLYRVVNVARKRYKELDFWSQKRGFFEELGHGISIGNSSVKQNNMVNGMVQYWPGGIKHVPKGWTLPSTLRPLKVGIPGKPPFENFVMVRHSSMGNQNITTYSGFCIDVFNEAVNIIRESYSFPFYEFEVFDGSYDDLVHSVYNKTYDLAVGDVTISANRSNYVEFTQPYTKSGLSLIVPLESKESQKALMFIKPFTWQLWLVTLCTLLYTMLVVWSIDRRTSDSVFEGQWTNQLNDALWFTFNSIFHSQREEIKSFLTRITMIVWLLVVFVITSSYTANLTSMLTVPLLEPSKVKSVEWLQETNSKIGCDGGSVWDYLVNKKNFSEKNVMNVSNQYDYQQLFANGSIVAAFLERPYLRFLVNQYCKSFTHTSKTFGFGAQGFVFQQGSPLVGNVSKAILRISENGVLKELQDKWFPVTSNCITSSNDHEDERLNPIGFVALYAIYVFVSIVCVSIYIAPRIRSKLALIATRNGIFDIHWIIVNFAQYFQRVGNRLPQETCICETQKIDVGVKPFEIELTSI